MFVKAALALAALVVVSSAPTTSDVKCVPMQWTGVAVGKFGLSGDKKRPPLGLHMIADVYADYAKKMEAMHQSIFEGEKHIGNFTFIRDAAKMENFMIDPVKKSCQITKDPMNPVEQICTNSTGVKLVHSLNVGDKVLDMYYRHFRDGDDLFTMMRDPFTIVNMVSSLKFRDMSELVALNYGNITQGVADESVFALPDYCKK